MKCKTEIYFESETTPLYQAFHIVVWVWLSLTFIENVSRFVAKTSYVIIGKAITSPLVNLFEERVV